MRSKLLKVAKIKILSLLTHINLLIYQIFKKLKFNNPILFQMTVQFFKMLKKYFKMVFHIYKIASRQKKKKKTSILINKINHKINSLTLICLMNKNL